MNHNTFFLLSTLSTGGAERVASDLSLHWPGEGVSMVLLQNKVSYPYKGNIISLDIPDSKNMVQKAFWGASALLKLRKLVKEKKPDFIVSFGKLQNLINLFSGARAILRVDNFYSASCN